MAERSLILSLKTKLVVALFVLALVPLALVWYTTFRQVDHYTDHLQERTYKTRKTILEKSNTAVENIVFTSLKDRAHYVASRLESHFVHLPEGEVKIDRRDTRLRKLAIEPVGGHGYTMVYNMAGVVIFHPNRKIEGQPLSQFEDEYPAFSSLVKQSFLGPVSGGYKWKNEAEEEAGWLLSSVRLQDLNLVVAAVMPRDEPLNQVNHIVEDSFLEFTRTLNSSVQEFRLRFMRFSLLYLFIVTMVVALIGTRLAKSIVKPIKELTRAVQGLGAGDVRSIVGVSQRDEIGELARSFVRMKRDIKLYREQITENQQELTAAYDEIRLLNRDLERKIQDRTHELEEALEELKSLDKNKDDFIALVSHELRTPLTSIIACTEALQGGGLAGGIQNKNQLLEIIRDESDRLSRLIADVLQIQRMEAGRMPFDFKKVNLNNLVEKACINLRQSAKQKDIEIHVIKHGDPRLKAIQADYDRMLQVMTNLLSNAIKFTPEHGDVHVEVDVSNDDLGNGELEYAKISVRDKGIGIQEKDAKRIFDKFYQAELIDHHSEGSGLGLPIARHIIEEHGGRIWHENVENGSVFHCLLPMTGD